MPESSCFCHLDGSLCDSQKSKVFQYLKGLVESDSPLNVETVIADRMFLIRSICRYCSFRLFIQTVLKSYNKQFIAQIFVSMFRNHHQLKIAKDRKVVMTNPNVHFPSDHNKRCQVILTNYWNYHAIRKHYLDFSFTKLNIQSMFQ